MNIGIDIDGVLTDVRKFTIEEGLKYCEENKKGRLIMNWTQKVRHFLIKFILSNF